MNETLIEKTINFVKQALEGSERGHDWWHIERVYNNALKISAHEHGDQLTIALSALLHDIADAKFHQGDETMGPRIAKEFLESMAVEAKLIDHVVAIIENISYKTNLGEVSFQSAELDIVQDADRLDAIGAIGIARAFHYGGFKNREIYNPSIAPQLNMSKEEYKNSQGPTINHFYEKLLRLKDLFKTETGKKMADARHEFMERYLEAFYAEVSVQRDA